MTVAPGLHLRPSRGGGIVASAGGEEDLVYYAIIQWFFPRKAKIAFLSLMTYLALC